MRDLADEFLNIYVDELIRILSPVGFPSASAIASTTFGSGDPDNMWVMVQKLEKQHALVGYIRLVLKLLRPDERVALLYECYYRERPGPDGGKMTQTEIAKELHINPHTLKSRLKTGRKALMETLEWHHQANSALKGTRYGASIGVV